LTDESTLLASARAGDLSAFGDIVELQKRHVYRLALNLTGSHEDAEDLSQEAFVRDLPGRRGCPNASLLA
jgi:DNA-directed RNA polymerase specialized sigma24 family protein